MVTTASNPFPSASGQRERTMTFLYGKGLIRDRRDEIVHNKTTRATNLSGAYYGRFMPPSGGFDY